MSDLISRSALLESLIYCKELGRKSAEAVGKVINEQPTVEIPVRGEWIECQSNDGYYECSICGKLRNKFHDGKTKFCPNCGARMDVKPELIIPMNQMIEVLEKAGVTQKKIEEYFFGKEGAE